MSPIYSTLYYFDLYLFPLTHEKTVWYSVTHFFGTISWLSRNTE